MLCKNIVHSFVIKRHYSVLNDSDVIDDIAFRTTLPHKVKTYVHFRLHKNYFLYLERFMKKISDDQWSSITHMPVHTFTMGVD